MTDEEARKQMVERLTEAMGGDHTPAVRAMLEGRLFACCTLSIEQFEQCKGGMHYLSADHFRAYTNVLAALDILKGLVDWRGRGDPHGAQHADGAVADRGTDP